MKNLSAVFLSLLIANPAWAVNLNSNLLLSNQFDGKASKRKTGLVQRVFAEPMAGAAAGGVLLGGATYLKFGLSNPAGLMTLGAAATGIVGGNIGATTQGFLRDTSLGSWGSLPLSVVSGSVLCAGLGTLRFGLRNTHAMKLLGAGGAVGSLIGALSVEGIRRLQAAKDPLLLKLPEGAKLILKNSFLIESMATRSGTTKQSVIETISIDLKGDSPEAVQGREKNRKVIEKLKELKNFNHLQSLWCQIKVKADVYEDIRVPAGTSFKFSRPFRYGHSNEDAKKGKVITIDSYDQSVTADFADPGAAQSLYCSFKAGWEHRSNAEFLSDLKISHLEALLAPYFTLEF